MFRTFLLLAVTSWTASVAAFGQAPAPEPASAAEGVVLRRAVGWLASEVPRWRREHPCYSCHNNGDGTRALIAAAGAGLIDLGGVEDTLAWLRAPERWVLNAEDGGVKDLPLSRIQFSAALARLTSEGAADQGALGRAAALLVADQRADGSWPISATSNVGSPSGYGTPLATAVARSVLRAVGTDAAREAVARADTWFRQSDPAAVLEASATLLGLEVAADPDAARVRRQALAILVAGQGRDGGWGPYTTAPSEPFDTAVAVLALQMLEGAPGLAGPVLSPIAVRESIDRGRAYLVAAQSDDGSWPETTRPALQESYSQRVSTTAWAVLALVDR